MSMKVRELIEELEQYPPDCPVVIRDQELEEVTQILLRDEQYFTEDHCYDEGLVVKIY